MASNRRDEHVRHCDEGSDEVLFLQRNCLLDIVKREYKIPWNMK